MVQAAAGQQHAAAVLADGRVLTWGLGVFGQLGHGARGEAADLLLPREVESALCRDVVQVRGRLERVPCAKQSGRSMWIAHQTRSGMSIISAP